MLQNYKKKEKTKRGQQFSFFFNSIKKLFMLSYIPNVSNAITSFINKSAFITGFRCLNRLNPFVKVHKDKLDKFSSQNIVYKINCKNNCEASFVEQTKRQLKTRIKEHKSNIKSDSSTHIVITEHMLNYHIIIFLIGKTKQFWI